MAIGKRVVDDLYIHLDCLDRLESGDFKDRVSQALSWVSADAPYKPNVAKIHVRLPRVSLLCYPRFEDEPFPTLAASWTFALGANSPPAFRTYDESINPPILHRKELLVDEGHPQRATWGQVSRSAEELGLFDDTSVIGFRQNWLRVLRAHGAEETAEGVRPIANAGSVELRLAPGDTSAEIQRHLTALSRTALSAPVQILLRHGLLPTSASFFDYGCGRGDDLAALMSEGYEVYGWDPHYRPDGERRAADVVNLGFVVNVIEDPAERVEAVQKAFALAKSVMSVAVMLQSDQAAGVPYRDGFLTTRSTFQHYFTQEELRDFVETVLHQPAFMVGPGIAVVFADKALEQRFALGRHRSRDLAVRLLASRLPRPPRERQPRVRALRPAEPSRVERLFAEHGELLEALWSSALELGRWPEPEELGDRFDRLFTHLGYARARRLIAAKNDLRLLEMAASARRDDVLVFLAAQQFGKRPQYKKLDARLQRDIRTFFGDYSRANSDALRALARCAQPSELLAACQEAASRGLGWLEADHSLQLHVSLVHRLPALLRIYIACGRLLWDPADEAQLVKIHIESGKLSFLEFIDFDQDPVPALKCRVKVNLRNFRCQLFEYGSEQYPMPILLWKSKYLHEDLPGYAQQLALDDRLAQYLPAELDVHSLYRTSLDKILDSHRKQLRGFDVVESTKIPDLDDSCGANFKYRDFIECGETQQRTQLRNIPLNPKTYNALHALATQVLDPVIDYFGPIRITYGFCSPALARHIKCHITPKLDQHASWELDTRGTAICDRRGAACDFIIDHEDMLNVARWLMENVAFDRIYVYNSDRPIHVSQGPSNARQALRVYRSDGPPYRPPTPFR